MWPIALIVYAFVAFVACGWLGEKYLLRGDRQTVDRIADLLDGNEWGPDTLEAVAEQVRRTGREIRDLDEYDYRLA